MPGCPGISPGRLLPAQEASPPSVGAAEFCLGWWIIENRKENDKLLQKWAAEKPTSRDELIRLAEATLIPLALGKQLDSPGLIFTHRWRQVSTYVLVARGYRPSLECQRARRRCRRRAAALAQGVHLPATESPSPRHPAAPRAGRAGDDGGTGPGAGRLQAWLPERNLAGLPWGGRKAAALGQHPRFTREQADAVLRGAGAGAAGGGWALRPGARSLKPSAERGEQSLRAAKEIIDRFLMESSGVVSSVTHAALSDTPKAPRQPPGCGGPDSPARGGRRGRVPASGRGVSGGCIPAKGPRHPPPAPCKRLCSWLSGARPWLKQAFK